MIRVQSDELRLIRMKPLEFQIPGPEDVLRLALRLVIVVFTHILRPGRHCPVYDRLARVHVDLDVHDQSPSSRRCGGGTDGHDSACRIPLPHYDVLHLMVIRDTSGPSAEDPDSTPVLPHHVYVETSL
jgi:hypothetical protein